MKFAIRIPEVVKTTLQGLFMLLPWLTCVFGIAGGLTLLAIYNEPLFVMVLVFGVPAMILLFIAYCVGENHRKSGGA